MLVRDMRKCLGGLEYWRKEVRVGLLGDMKYWEVQAVKEKGKVISTGILIKIGGLQSQPEP